MKNREKIDRFIDFLKIPSVSGTAGEKEACEYLEQILEEYHVEHFRISKSPDRPNLAAVVRAEHPVDTPMVLISHIDVVEAEPEKWKYPPFEAVRAEQRIWGRGTLDTKHLTMMELYAFLHLKGMEKRLTRDVWLLATVDEETGSVYGMQYVKQELPQLFANALVINEGGGFPLCICQKDVLPVTMGEKGTAIVQLEAEGTGGHASSPVEDQAVLKITKALENIFSMEEKLERTSSQIYQKMKSLTDYLSWDNETGAGILSYCGQNSIGMSSYKIGERSNVIAAKAEAELKFELLPGLGEKAVKQFLDKAVKDLPVKYKVTEFIPGFEMDLESREYKAYVRQIENICQKAGMTCQVIPMLALGHTDGRLFGVEGSTVLGLSPVLPEDSFDKVLRQVHGNNESITESSFLFGCKVIEELVMRNCVEEPKDERTADV